MQASSMIFSLFGLLVGLGIGEILRGLGKVWRIQAGVAATKREIRLGWLVPLFAVLVIMDQTHFYITAYDMRDAIPFTYLSLLAILVVVGTYFVCSTFVFPDDPEDWPDFDDYYLRVRKIIAGGIIAAKLALLVMASGLALTGHRFDGTHPASPIGALLTLLNMAALIALIFVSSKRVSLILLTALIFSLIGQAVADLA